MSINILKEILPHLEDAILLKALQKHNYQLDNAILELVNSPDAPLTPTRKPRTTPPKGWAQFTKNNQKTPTTPVPQEPVERPYKYSNGYTPNKIKGVFPSLEVSVTKVSQQDPGMVFLSSMFPNISSSIIMETFAKCKKSISHAVEDLLSSKIAETVAKPIDSEKNDANNKNDKQPQITSRTVARKLDFNSSPSADTETFDSDVFQEVYNLERRDATKAARKRNKLFMKAANAYDNGNHSLAKKLAEEGHHHNHLMIEANKRAADNIFEIRNRHNVINKIDLHGLQASEAITKVSERISHLGEINMESRQSGIAHTEKLANLEIITGWGKGQTGVPILRPIIEDFLFTNSYTFIEPAPGKFLVTLKM